MPVTGTMKQKREARKTKRKAKRKLRSDARAAGVAKPRKVTKLTKTKGGTYATYKKNSKPAKKFRDAFKNAKAAGKKTFTWNGNSYTTATKGSSTKPKKNTTKKNTTKKNGAGSNLKTKAGIAGAKLLVKAGKKLKKGYMTMKERKAKRDAANKKIREQRNKKK